MPSYIIKYQILTLHLYNNSEKLLNNLLIIKISEGPTVRIIYDLGDGSTNIVWYWALYGGALNLVHHCVSSDKKLEH